MALCTLFFTPARCFTPSLCTISSVVKKSCVTLNKDPSGMSIVIPGRHNVSKCGERAFEKGRLSFRISTWEVCQSGTQILYRARERYGPTKVEKGWQPLGRNAGSCLKMGANGMALFLKTLRVPPNLNLVPIIIPATVSVAEKVFTQSHQVCVTWNSSPKALGQDPQHGPISTTICLC